MTDIATTDGSLPGYIPSGIIISVIISSAIKAITAFVDFDNVVSIFIHADFIVCPFVYQALALDSTSTFVKVILKLKKLKPDMSAQLLFVPNMVDRKFGTVDELDNFKKNADAVFEKIGILTPRVYDRAELKRISTILYTPKQKQELNACFATLDANIFS